MAKIEFTRLLRSGEAGFGVNEWNGSAQSRPDFRFRSRTLNTGRGQAQVPQSAMIPIPLVACAGNSGKMASAGDSNFDCEERLQSDANPNLTAPLLPGLELIRGLACLQVFVSHIFTVLMFHSRIKINPSYWKFAALDWSYESVIVFFVLSGYVIALSQQRKHRNFSSFMSARFERLGPLYLVALTISFGLEAFLSPPPAYKQLLGHLIFIQGSALTPLFNTNTPLWSLSFEFYFYLIFAFTIGRNWKLLNIGWFGLGLGAMILSLAGFTAPGVPGYFQGILAMSPVWLLGVLLVHRPLYVRTSISQNLMLFGLFPLANHSLSFLGLSNSPAHALITGLLVAPLLCSAAQTQPVRFQASLLSWVCLLGLYSALACAFLASNQGPNHHTETLVALSVPFLLPLLVPIYHRIFGKNTPLFTPRVTGFSLGLGKMSYAIYVIHFPILFALGTTLLNPVLQIIFGTILVMLSAWLLEYRLQPAVGALFKSRWPPSHPVVSS
jgi:peptidoglycan/LPS O-acetylase OafA/YrhL